MGNKYVSKSVKRPEGSCKECRWNPIGTEKCILKNRPIAETCADFKPRINAKKKASKPDHPQAHTSIEKPTNKGAEPDHHKRGKLDEEFLETIGDLMVEADYVVVVKGDFEFTIRKKAEKVTVKEK